MTGMLIVAGALGLFVGAMFYFDDLKRKRKEQHRADIRGRPVEKTTDDLIAESTEIGMARKLDLELFRGYLEEFERRLARKLCIISAVAIGVAAALVKYLE